MKEAVEHSRITFENMLKQWHNLTHKQRQEIQSNIDYLNEQLTTPAVGVTLPTECIRKDNEHKFCFEVNKCKKCMQ